MNNQDYIIQIHDLKKSYDKGKIQALNGMDLEIKRVNSYLLWDLLVPVNLLYLT